MDGEQTMDVQPEVSEVAHALPPEVHVDSPKDEMARACSPA